jgi:CheY-like chemotaxis protein
MTSPTIFVTNDDDAYVTLVKELLIEEGYSNVSTHVGSGAFYRIREVQPALILLDINITNPGRGWSTLEATRLHPSTRDIPVIVCSTDMQLLNTKQQLLRDLHCSTLEKPFNLKTLLEAIINTIGPPPSTTQ